MNSEEAKLFRERLRTLREAKNLSQREIEERIGKEENYITRVETGRIDTPPIEMTAKIARALDVSMSELYFFEGLDDNADELRAKIQALIQIDDPKQLRKYYRLMLVSHE
jgi:transcriptional regulator with XRE-family HTH domain